MQDGREILRPSRAEELLLLLPEGRRHLKSVSTLLRSLQRPLLHHAVQTAGRNPHDRVETRVAVAVCGDRAEAVVIDIAIPRRTSWAGIRVQVVNLNRGRVKIELRILCVPSERTAHHVDVDRTELTGRALSAHPGVSDRGELAESVPDALPVHADVRGEPAVEYCERLVHRGDAARVSRHHAEPELIELEELLRRHRHGAHSGDVWQVVGAAPAGARPRLLLDRDAAHAHAALGAAGAEAAIGLHSGAGFRRRPRAEERSVGLGVVVQEPLSEGADDVRSVRH